MSGKFGQNGKENIVPTKIMDSIVWVDVDELTLAPFNPSRRVLDVSDLVKSMQEEGFWWWCPITITGEGVVGDGHRRVTAARKVGIQLITAIVVDDEISAEDIWGKTNTRKPINAAQSLEAHVRGLPLENIPRPHRPTLERLYKIGGRELVEYVQRSGYSPSIISDANALAFRIGLKGDEVFIRKAIYWLVNWRIVSTVHFMLRNNMDVTPLKKCVEQNKPFTLFVGQAGSSG